MTLAADVHDVDVIVLGAGVSGLFAAAQLQQNGVDYVVLEASNRIGGRIKSARLGNNTVELGALWMHGENNPL